jgi:hypothetical protein
MKIPFVMFACAFAATAAATPPPVPAVTVAATDIKQLQFDITPVARANWYELWFRANPNAQWVKYAQTPAQRPLIRVAVSVHLLDWPQARYTVKACNPGGCSTSAELGVNAGKLDAIGFLKPTPATGVHDFGGHVAVSADGKTIAVVSGETINSEVNCAVIYVYRRTTSTSGWRLEARLKPSINHSGAAQYYLGDQLAISGDGALIAFGSWLEDAAGPLPNQETGAVYLFRRTGTGWQQSQRIAGTMWSDQYGRSVNVDDAGQTLVVEHYPHDPNDSSQVTETLDVWRSTNGQAFVRTAQIPAPSSDGGPDECSGIAISGDGETIARGCYPRPYDQWTVYLQVLKAPAWSEDSRISTPGATNSGADLTFDGSQVLVQMGNYGYAYKRGASGWAIEGYLTDFGGDDDGASRRHVAISRDGKIAAIGNWSDIAAGLGPIFPPYQTADHPSGGVVIHERKANGTWSVRRAIKPGNTNDQNFGNVLALGDNGRVLVVGAPLDASAASGIDGNRDDDSAYGRGAVWVY